MLIGQARRRFWEWFAGVRSTGALRKRPSGRSHWRSPRALRVEPLEQRELLSVTPGAQTWKDFAFTSTGLVTGKLTMPYDAGPPYGTINLPVSVYHDAQYEGAAFNGTIDYSTSPNQGTIGSNGSSITGQDAWKINVPAYYKPPAPWSWVLKGGSVISIADAGGKLTGTVDLTTENETTKYFKALFAGESSGGYDLGGVYDVAGSFSTSNFSINATFSINKPELWGSFTYKGTMTPTDTTPFDVRLGQPLAWGQGNSVTFDVDLSGPVHTAKSETTPITTIQVFWAKGPNLSDRISKTPLTLDTAKGSPYKSGIPLYWNQAFGHYVISDFVTPSTKIPSNATNLLFVAKYDGQDHLLGTLALPSVSIEKRTVNEPAAGTTVGEQFNVTYTVPEGFAPLNSNPVTVAWKTGNGTAKAKTDYLTNSGTLTFNPKATATQQITVSIVGDNTYEPDETFNISATVKNASFGGTVAETIHDLNVPKVKINDVTGFEGIRGTVNYPFVVELTNPSSQWIKVDYTLQDGAAVNFEGNPWEPPLGPSQVATANLDYVSPSGQPKTLTFGPGVTKLTFNVVVKGDTVDECTEYFSVVLSNARTQGGVTISTVDKAGVGVGEIKNGAFVRAGGVASRQAAASAALAAYFDQLGQKKDDEAVDLALAVV